MSKNVNDEVSKDSLLVKTRKSIGMPHGQLHVRQQQHDIVWREGEERSTCIR